MADLSIGSSLFTLGTSVISFVAGVAGASWLQDRQRMIRNREAAGVLLADLDRIERELSKTGGLSFATQLHGSLPVPPRIHRWVEPLIPQLGGEDRGVVAGCLALELHLANLDAMLSRYPEADEAMVMAEGRHDEAVRVSEALSTSGDPQRMSRADSDVEYTEMLRENAKREHGRIIVRINYSHDSAIASIHDLRGRLQPIAAREIGWLPIPAGTELSPHYFGPDLEAADGAAPRPNPTTGHTGLPPHDV